MFVNNIKDYNLASLFQVVNILNEKHPLWWQTFLEKVMFNSSVTFVNYTTLIIRIYDLEIHNLVILYNVLKLLKKYRLVNKVINKKEFLIVHLNDEKIISYLTDSKKWLNLVVYKYLSDVYDLNTLTLEPTEDENLRFVYQGTIYHIYTSPKEKMNSNKYHKYIYLYKDKGKTSSVLLDNELKYVRNKYDFIKDFKRLVEKNF
ncbi:MAG: hypothetical protein IJX78_04970 [Bacilli bacterium]|nr:hypothetical protein [Bacilli bacterium]